MNRTQITNVSIEWIMKNVTASSDGFSSCSCGYKYCSLWRHCTGTRSLNWEAMLEYKYGDCSDILIESIIRDGIKKPICILVEPHGGFLQGNGHHRLSVAFYLAMDTIPVVFAFDGNYMHSDITGC